MRELFLFQVGFGGVGRALARQLLAQQERLAARYGIMLRYLALADRSALLGGTGLEADEVAAALAAKEAGRALVGLAGAREGDWREVLPERPCIIVDVTAADRMELPLGEAVAAGHRVVLANKRPLTESLASFRALTGAGKTRYEATAGAGLPIIGTLQALIDSGDTVTRIEASMSGTLGFLCGALEEGQALSAAVYYARAQGWTEPDPRDDLSGADVARKALILGRTCGLAWAANTIAGEPWYPPALSAVEVGEFMERLVELDAEYAARVEAAAGRGAVLRYVATVEPAGASVGLREVALGHPLATLRGPDNLFSFTTTRYPERPLVVRGPGAGVEVTAAGVLGDIIAHAREME